MKVALIGTGNMAWHLAQVFEKRGIEIVEIYGRDAVKAINMASFLYEARINADLDFSESEAKVFFLCVSDSAIAEVCSKLLLPEDAVVVHTSGSTPLKTLIDTLGIYHDLKTNAGVFYPIMTFTKGKELNFAKIPICIEAENLYAQDMLTRIATAISDDVNFVNSHERLVLHVAAVFSCNFTNHLWALSKEIVESEDLDFDLLKPLIQETFQKAMAATHPADVQTGPAIRQDGVTVAAHRGYVADDEDLSQVYQTLTRSIQDWHQ
jgi:predicted short-subunit dehydrogenase-like oxidoreductase (DUF2520 family)